MPNDFEVQKARRQAISELIRQGAVSTQSELVNGLQLRGFTATQSSVSRDLRHLGVAKVAGAYVLPATFLSAEESARNGGLDSVELSRWVRSVQAAGPHLMIVRTAVGAAPQVAASLDAKGWPEIAGTVAGDDTIFVATEGKAAQSRVARRLFDAGGPAPALG